MSAYGSLYHQIYHCINHSYLKKWWWITILFLQFKSAFTSVTLHFYNKEMNNHFQHSHIAYVSLVQMYFSHQSSGQLFIFYNCSINTTLIILCDILQIKTIWSFTIPLSPPQNLHAILRIIGMSSSHRYNIPMCLIIWHTIISVDWLSCSLSDSFELSKYFKSHSTSVSSFIVVDLVNRLSWLSFVYTITGLSKPTKE